MHDESNQILEHRRQDIAMMIAGAKPEEIIENVRRNAVTYIEKRVAMYYFDELEDSFGDCVETPTLTIFG